MRTQIEKRKRGVDSEGTKEVEELKENINGLEREVKHL